MADLLEDGDKTTNRSHPLRDVTYSYKSDAPWPLLGKNPEEERSRNVSSNDVRDILDTLQHIRSEIDAHVEPLLELKTSVDYIERHLLGDRRRKKVGTREKCFEFLEGKIVTRTMLLASFFWQALNVLLVDAFDMTERETNQFLYSTYIMLGFQAVHLAFILMLSIKLVHQVIHRTVNWFFIVQSYLSTIIMFSGLYLLIHNFNSASFQGLSMDKNPQEALFEWYIDFLVFSIGVMSAGISKVLPTMWYAELVVGVQMLVSMVYWMFILGYGLDNVINAGPPAEAIDETFVIDESFSRSSINSHDDEQLVSLDEEPLEAKRR